MSSSNFIREILDFNIICMSQVMTVLRVLRNFYQPKLPEKQELPRVLCFGEFKSVSFVEGAMSCILMDSEHIHLLDILEN